MTPVDTSSFSLQSGLVDELQRRAKGAKNTQAASSQPTLPPEQHQEVQRAAEGFESMFVHMMLKEMRKNIQMSDESKGNTFGADTLGGYADLQFADSLSKNNALGIAGMVYKELSGGFEMPTSPVTESKPNNSNSTSIHDMISTISTAAQTQSVESMGFGSFFDKVKERLRPYEANIRDAAISFGLDTSLIKGVIAAESAGRSKVESSAGAKGLMQLMDATASDMGVIDAFDPEQNIQGGSRYLSNMLNMFDGDLEKALAAYNAGPGNVQKYDGIPPFEETQKYIANVKRYSNVFSILEKNSLM